MPSQSQSSQPILPTVVVPSPPAILTNPEAEDQDEDLELPTLAQEETTGSPSKKQKTGKKKKKPDDNDESPGHSPRHDPASSSNYNPNNPANLPVQYEREEELIPHVPTADSQRTRSYDDHQADLVLDEAHWSLMTAEEKICANPGSFTVPRDIEGNPVLLGRVKGTFIPSPRCGFSHQKHTDQNHVDQLCKNMTDDDRALLVLYSSKQESLKASSTSGKKRKEATATEIRAYQKQFLEAKQLECKSWLDNEVFDLVDTRKIQVRNWVTGRWVLTLKRDKDGNFLNAGSSEASKTSRRMISSPAASRSGFRLAIQAASNKGWNIFHMDLKTAFLQRKAYDQSRDIICQIPPEMGYPPHIGSRMKKPAYGLNDAPRRWWNILGSALRSYGLVPTRADRCTYVYYGKQLPKPALVSEKKSSTTFDLEGAVDYLMDPVSGNNAKNRQVHGALSLHVDNLLMTGGDVFEKEIMGRLRKDFQVGSEDKNDCLFVGQRIQWKQDDKHGWYINVHQNVAIGELQEITFDKHLKDDTPLTPQMHTAYRSVLGQINWLQSRNGVRPRHHHRPLRTFVTVRTIKSIPLSVRFWPLRGKTHIVGYPDASYRNNEDKSSQRAHVIFLAEQRDLRQGSSNSRGSLVDYETHKITATTMSTTVAELHGLMRYQSDLCNLVCSITSKTCPFSI